MERRKRWRAHVRVDSYAEMPMFASLRTIKMDTTQIVVMQAVGEQHFHWINHLSRLLSEMNLLSAALDAPYTNKQLLVVIPPSSTADEFCDTIQHQASSININLAMRVEPCTLETHPMVVEQLVKTALMHAFYTQRSIVLGKDPSLQVLLTGSLRSGEISTIDVYGVDIDADEMGVKDFMIECSPSVMMLKTLALEPSDPAQNDTTLIDSVSTGDLFGESRMIALPEMSSCWVISHHKGIPQPSPLQQRNWSMGYDAHIPRTDEDFRTYWQSIHGIMLPEDVGGYVRVRFSSQSVLTYPACCVASQWTLLHKQTRVEALDVIRLFLSMLRAAFGEENVRLSSPTDQEPKTVVFLPASALIVNTEDAQTVQPSGKKRRMIRKRKNEV